MSGVPTVFVFNSIAASNGPHNIDTNRLIFEGLLTFMLHTFFKTEISSACTRLRVKHFVDGFSYIFFLLHIFFFRGVITK